MFADDLLFLWLSVGSYWSCVYCWKQTDSLEDCVISNPAHNLDLFECKNCKNSSLTCQSRQKYLKTGKKSKEISCTFFKFGKSKQQKRNFWFKTSLTFTTQTKPETKFPHCWIDLSSNPLIQNVDWNSNFMDSKSRG